MIRPKPNLVAVFSFSLTCLFAFRAQAVSPVVKSVMGEPVRLVFSDGREAVMKDSKISLPKVKIPVTISETLCSDRQNIQCEFDLGIVQHFYFFAWSKHSDQSKINQQIKSADPFLSGLTETNATLTGAEIPFAPKLTSQLYPPRIVCKDFSWLPGANKSAPASLKVVRWEGELMLPNPETGVNENRGFTGAYNVVFKRESDQALSLQNIEKISNVIGQTGFGTVFLFAAPTLDLVVDDGKGDTCQATLQIDGSALQAQAADLKRPDAATEKNVYIVGSDEALSIPRVIDLRSTIKALTSTKEEDFK